MLGTLFISPVPSHAWLHWGEEVRPLPPLGRHWCCGYEDGHGDTAGKGTLLVTCFLLGHLPCAQRGCSASSQVAFVPLERAPQDPQGMHSGIPGGARRVCLHHSHPGQEITPVTPGNAFSVPFPSPIATAGHRHPPHLLLPSHLHIWGLLEKL